MSKDTNYIKALGSFLNYYESDLEYIARFQKIISRGINDEDLDGKKPGSFKAFINEYRVARNISSSAENENNIKKLLEITQDWIKSDKPNDVDGLAEAICKAEITPRNRIPVSLASKILMLNNPWEILPMDSLTKASLKYSGTTYSEFKTKLDKFKDDKKTRDRLLCELAEIGRYLSQIENKFKHCLKDIETIRYNRYADKVLWVGLENK